MRLKLGESELQTLRFVARHPDCTVREACEHFARENGWARTTVLKTLDRLRLKGLLDRVEVEGLFRYRSVHRDEEIQEALVHQFLAGSMGGSVKTLLSHLHTYPSLSEQDVQELRKLVDDLEAK